jgi:uncharacterized protein YndB with AHSA1/START domain
MSSPEKQRQVSVSRTMAFPASDIFEVLSDASLHPVIDGSGMVVAARGEAEPLTMGSTFGMNMRMGVPYRMTNTVVEFDQDRLIAWCHPGKHRWRYELEAADGGGTVVTETFDWSTSIFPPAIEWMKYPTKHVPNMERTLEKLEAFLTNRASAL